MNRSALLLLSFLLAIPMMAFSQDVSKPAFADAFTETNLRKLRLQLPNHLHVSGHSVILPSGRILACSVLYTVAKKEEERVKWTLDELLAGLSHEHSHIRCAALLLLVNETKMPEDHPSFLMSPEELQSSGVLSRWQKIVSEAKK
jgi:hypothetical protein